MVMQTTVAWVRDTIQGTEYEGGVYHGKLVFPAEYPFKPPSISLFTPNGRFATNTKLCLSMTDYHPESWNPMWSVGTILTGLLSFMYDTQATTGSITTSKQDKERMARDSLTFNAKNPTFRKLFPQWVEELARRNAAAAQPPASALASSPGPTPAPGQEPPAAALDGQQRAPSQQLQQQAGSAPGEVGDGRAGTGQQPVNDRRGAPQQPISNTIVTLAIVVAVLAVVWIRLDGPAALILQYVVVRDFRTTPLGQSPGFDLVASSTADSGALVLMEDAVLMLRICVPRTIQGEIMSSIPRPSNLPGTQVSISNISQANCTNNTAAPPVSRCWPDLGVYADVAVAGFDIDAFGRATATHYTLYMLRVPYLCEKQMTDECVASLGPLGCFLYIESGSAKEGQGSRPPNGNCTPNIGGGSPPASTGGPPSTNTNGRFVSGTPTGGSQHNQHSNGRGVRLPSGVGTCVLSSTDVDASSPLVIVTPFTPHRSDLKLDVQCDTEVKLLPIIRGKGSYGRVVEGLYGGERVAVKLVVDVDEWSGPTDSLVSSFAQEVEVLGRCQHPNIVRLLAACLKPPRLCLVMELMDTSLERLVHSKPGELLPLPTVLHIAADIARGLAYLHPTIVHRDLKPGNVLLSNTDCMRPIAKLTDFGLSRLRSTVLVTRHPEAGTPAYMAPEAFDASNYVITHKADIYALGVILWEMLTGCVPWDGCSMVAIAYSITVRHHRLPLSKLDACRCPPKLRKLIHQCWDPDPQRRPAAAELVKQLTLVLQLVQGDLEAPVSSGSGTNSGYRMVSGNVDGSSAPPKEKFNGPATAYSSGLSGSRKQLGRSSAAYVSQSQSEA
ncbi:hypothetical protein GPECTOR_79g129 [Gonium pectorale]|uniref:Protein kinase domain-containing protein n=1 Tax=Gonium pectorale TaxID=33097 RepID=A0A150G3G2_GONPE|nr:hypothetical protein GPECTOR_79g129 [Gonium pectorale]|eukprot:KXZ43850.1 hypothetical protein GPECTOR_79g129 [Gonium pectorale]